MAIFAFCVFSQAFGFEKFPISSITPDQDRFGVFQLGSHQSLELTLDCDSFLFGLIIKGQNRYDFFHFFEGECYDISQYLTKWTEAGEKACLKIDLGAKDWKLEKGADGCQ